MPGVLIKLTPLALTRTQVQDYALPRIPIKEEDHRKSGFEERHGEGTVERDALEAPYPGMLAQVVREAIAPYRDLSLQQRLFDTERTRAPPSATGMAGRDLPLSRGIGAT
jgi:hypothetical protein